MKTPSGSVTLGGATMTWQARPLHPPRLNTSDGEGPGPFMIALYEVKVSLRGEGLDDANFTLRQMGYERTVTFDADPFGDSAPSRGNAGTANPAQRRN
jgi:hypothetical protein